MFFLPALLKSVFLKQPFDIENSDTEESINQFPRPEM